MLLPDKYRSNVGFPIVNLDMDEPLSLMRQSSLVLSEHPLSALAKADPGAAREIMHELVYVEHRKVDLGFSALSVDLRKAELAAAVAQTAQIAASHIEQIRTHPNERRTKTVHRRGWFATESITSKSW